jgi:predicted nucleic acid-binding protein
VIVVDTSAVLAALAGRPRPEDLHVRLAQDGDLHAPHLIDVEVVHALRRLVRARHLTEDRAVDVRTDFGDLAIVRYPHHPLADRMWELRHNLSAYDATFVVLAEMLGVPLITCDRGLAGSSGHAALIELFATT